MGLDMELGMLDMGLGMGLGMGLTPLLKAPLSWNMAASRLAVIVDRASPVVLTPPAC